MKGPSNFCGYVKSLVADLGLSVRVGKYSPQLDGCVVTGSRSEVEELAMQLDSIVAESMDVSADFVDQIVDL